MEASQSQSQLQSQSQDIEVGLKSLTLCCPNNDQKIMHHNSCIMASNLMSPPTSPAHSHIGDYIGMESCVDMKRCEDVQVMKVNNAATTTMYNQCVRSKSDSSSGKTKKMREFPPPISLLARTENLYPHMPFVLKRYYTNDGRLILREEWVRHHEYFRAYRTNGHLTLQLVLLEDGDDDDDDLYPPFDDENKNKHEHEEEEEIEGLVNQTPKSCNDNECIDIDAGGRSNEGGGMCLKYNNVIISSSCYLGVPVPVPVLAPAIKPVPLS